jgi:LacI family transcriptional regulator
MERIRGLAGALSSLEYELISYSVEDGAQLGNYLSMLSTGDRVDGVVMMALPVDADSLRLFRRRGIPLVFVETRMEQVCSIVTDNLEGGALAARCLLDKGYRRPAFMGEGGHEDFLIDSSGSRLSGFRSMLGEAGVSLGTSSTFLHFSGYRHILFAAEQLLSTRPFPDAVFTASDYEAMVLCRAARDRGMRVPGDLAVLGYDNIEAARFLGLSTIDQHLEESGRLAGEYMDLAFRGDYSGIPEITRLPVELVERETV